MPFAAAYLCPDTPLHSVWNCVGLNCMPTYVYTYRYHSQVEP